ncbi:MAG: UDP-N-acetylmuramate--L-alanine ligase [Deltaproteobacteria bacterium]|nr:UDP-N-acetylmuramate--L-alanine ligase [Deltaproteobacteria bacterium]
MSAADSTSGVKELIIVSSIVQSYHLIGIGGIGMSGLAELLVRQGHQVSGSDLAANAQTQRLEALGVKICLGHHPDHLPDTGIVVVSAAIKGDNPELQAAQSQGRQVLSRAQLLARLMMGKFQIAVAGTHGKTTTTSMVASILRQAGLDPTVVVGAVVDSLGSNAVLGQGKYFVAEADESDGSFVALTPHLAVVTNIDRDHLDHYRDLSHIQEAFAAFLHRVQPGGLIVACQDDPHLKPLLGRINRPILSYSLTPAADFWAADLDLKGFTSHYCLMRGNQELGRVCLPLAGQHYVSNSLAAAAATHALGVEFEAIQHGLAQLGQVHRRFQIKGESQGITVVDDYGHHPTEIRVTLEAIAQSFHGRRLLVVFQPHRYSRTRALLTDFFSAFPCADVLFLTEIYGAGEMVIPEVSGHCLFDGIKQNGHHQVYYVEDRAELIDRLWETLYPGDVVVTMGAGDIWKTGEELLKRLESQPLRSPGQNYRPPPQVGKVN